MAQRPGELGQGIDSRQRVQQRPRRHRVVELPQQEGALGPTPQRCLVRQLQGDRTEHPHHHRAGDRPEQEPTERVDGAKRRYPQPGRSHVPTTLPAASNRSASSVAPASAASGVYGECEPPDRRCGAIRAPSTAPTSTPAAESAPAIRPRRKPVSAIRAMKPRAIQSTAVTAGG